MRFPILVVSCLFGLLPTTDAQDWPRFLGPNGTASIDAPGASLSWPDAGPEVVWKVETGPGYGGAAIYGDEVFLLDRIQGEADILRVYELGTGRKRWEASYPAPGSLNFKGSRTVPIVTESYVFTAGGHGDVTAFGREAEAIVWSLNVEKELGGRRPVFGYSSNPLLVAETLVVAVLGEDVGLVGIDIESGEIRWKSESVGYTHSSPVLLTLAGIPQIVMSSGPKSASGEREPKPSWFAGFDPTTGERLWQYETLLASVPIPPPVQVDDERIFITGGYGSGSTMLRITKPEQEYKFEELFHIARGSQLHPPIVYEDHLYLVMNENANRSRRRQAEGGLACLDLQGNELWRTGADPYLDFGGSIRVGDLLLVHDGASGELYGVATDPSKFTPLGHFSPFQYEPGGDEQVWNPLAFARGYLVTRSHRDLVGVRMER